MRWRRKRRKGGEMEGKGGEMEGKEKDRRVGCGGEREG